MTLPIFVVSMLILVLLLAAMPFVTRKSECFGINVGTKLNQSATLLVWKRSYAVWVGAIGLFIFCVTFFLYVRDYWVSHVLSAGVLSFLVFAFGIYLIYHMKTKQWKSEQIASGRLMETSVVLVEVSRSRDTSTLSWKWFLTPCVLLGISGILTVLFYEKAPNLIPAYLDFNGTVHEARLKTPLNASLLLFSQVQVILLFLVLHFLIGRSKQIIDQDDPLISLERAKRSRLIYSKAMLYSSFIATGFFALLQVAFLFELGSDFIRMMTIAVFVSMFGILVWITLFVGQAGSKLHVMGIRQERRSIQKDDRYWKLGIFYVNKYDPVIFIEKRFGIGWTVNLARPIVWMGALLLILFGLLERFLF
ncbi:hypothetical protein MFLO_12766 [Listeria floridensis FSL S10-1187]|uniref:DUF5808 domain-containing protein n=1 Tax=Listeria floridensis FSL S10-1187 TaxID=1265817 RepID=A0ABP3AVR6_9LIST|nr:DUF5808 domain-containing protein [Listeria floridensis]EUJ28034.1 hypothetical protein MFLO_12766 [Listeria floridensis FSL S10-1187]